MVSVELTSNGHRRRINSHSCPLFGIRVPFLLLRRNQRWNHSEGQCDIPAHSDVDRCKVRECRHLPDPTTGWRAASRSRTLCSRRGRLGPLVKDCTLLGPQCIGEQLNVPEEKLCLDIGLKYGTVEVHSRIVNIILRK